MDIKKPVNKVVGSVLSVLLLIMALIVLWQVAARYVLQISSSWSNELVSFIFIWVGFLGAAYVTGLKMHLAIDLLVRKVNQKTANILQYIIYIITILFAIGVMVIGGVNLVKLQLEINQTTPALNLPIGYVYIAMPLSGLLIIFYTIVNIFETEQTSTENGDQ